MSKKTLLKSIIAVSAATTMLISSTAFAEITVNTTPRYIVGSNNVEVVTTVNGLNNGDQVTYLAGNEADPVYIDQTEAAGENGIAVATFKYQAAKTDIVGQNIAVKLAKNNATFTDGAPISGAYNVQDPTKFVFNVTVGDAAATEQKFAPEELGISVAIDIGTLPNGKEIDYVKVNDTTLESSAWSVNETSLTVTHGITLTTPVGDTAGFTPENASITVALKDTIVVEPVEAPVLVTEGLKTNNYSYTFSGDNEPTVGKMFAVYGNKDAYTGGEWGIAVSVNNDTGFNETDSSSYVLYPTTDTTADTFGIGILDPNITTGTITFATYYKPVSGDIMFGTPGKVIFD